MHPGVIFRPKYNDYEQSYRRNGKHRLGRLRVKEHSAYVKNGQLDISAAAEHVIFEQQMLLILTTRKSLITSVTT